MAGDEDRLEPLDSHNALAVRLAHRDLDLVDPGSLASNQIECSVARVRGLRDGADVAHRLAESLRIEADHLRRRVKALRDRPYVVVADRAHRAERLGHDEVGLEVGKQVLVERVDRLTAVHSLTHRFIDLGVPEPGRQQVARDVS